MELLLAFLLALCIVALASAWAALRTERARSLRLEERLAAVRPAASIPPAAEFEPASLSPAAAPAASPAPWAEKIPGAAETAPTAGTIERLVATLHPPADRLADSIRDSEPVLAEAAERLRSPMPPPSSSPGFGETSAPAPGIEHVETAVATAERLSDERARLADDVRSLRTALERVASIDGALGRSLTELSRTAEALLPLASSVSGLADRANLLGLNVSLLAARAGEAGAPFDEAAAELRALFEEARRLSREVSDTARRTEASARRVAGLVEESTGAAVAGEERGARAFQRLGALEGLGGELGRALEDAVRGARAAAEETTRMAERLETARTALEARTIESARLRADGEAVRGALRAAAERIEALRLDGAALRTAALRVTTGA